VSPPAAVLVLMGVDGCGRTTLAAALQRALAPHPANGTADGAAVQLLCSPALQRAQRAALRARLPGLHFIYLEIDVRSAARRLQGRPAREASARSIAGQFAQLEPPDGEADVLRLCALQPVAALLRQILDWPPVAALAPRIDGQAAAAGDGR